MVVGFCCRKFCRDGVQVRRPTAAATAMDQTRPSRATCTDTGTVASSTGHVDPVKQRPCSAPVTYSIASPTALTNQRPHTAHGCRSVSMATAAVATDAEQDESQHHRRHSVSPDRPPNAGQL